MLSGLGFFSSHATKHMWSALLRRSRHACAASLAGGAVLLAGCAHQTSAPLYEQLGGVDKISAVVSKTMDRVAADNRTMRTFDGVRLSYLKQSVSNYICKAADGPCVYDGETMHNSHADLNIGGSEFDLMVQALREELDAAGISPAAKNELLRRLGPTRRDIVKH
jgi:hemoglobin